MAQLEGVPARKIPYGYRSERRSRPAQTESIAGTLATSLWLGTLSTSYPFSFLSECLCYVEFISSILPSAVRDLAVVSCPY